MILAGLALAGINEQSGYHIGDGRADTQRDVKHSEKFQCRHGGLSPTRATHMVRFANGSGADTPSREVPRLTVNSGCPASRGFFIGETMSKSRQAFRRTDVLRAINAVKDAGLPISAVRISPQGEIEVETAKTQAQDSATDLERWLDSRGPNHARPS